MGKEHECCGGKGCKNKEDSDKCNNEDMDVMELADLADAKADAIISLLIKKKLITQAEIEAAVDELYEKEDQEEHHQLRVHPESNVAGSRMHSKPRSKHPPCH